MKRRIERNERTNRNQRMIKENRRNFGNRRMIKENKSDFLYADDIYFVIDDPKDLNYAGIVWDVVIDDKHFITTGEAKHGQYDEKEARDNVVEWCVENNIIVPIKTINDLIIYEDDFDDFEEFDDWIWDNYEVCCETNYFIPNDYFGGINDVTQEVRGEVRYNDENSEFINKIKEQFGIGEDEKVNFNESKRIRNRRMMKESKELSLIDSIEVMTPYFSEIGYFGEGSWYDAMEYSMNNSGGWRLPSIEEGNEMLKKYYNKMKIMCDDRNVWIWTNRENEYKYSNYDFDSAFAMTYNIANAYAKKMDYYIFLIR